MSMDTTLPSFGDLTEKVQPVQPAYVSHVVMDGTQVYATCSSRERAEEQLAVIKDINKYLKNHRYPSEHIIVVPHLPANSHVARLRRLAGQLNAMTSSSFMASYQRWFSGPTPHETLGVSEPARTTGNQK